MSAPDRPTVAEFLRTREATSRSRSQDWLDLQAAHDAIAEEVLATPIPLQWIHFAHDGRWHAVYAQARGGYWLYCSRFFRTDAVLEASAAAALDKGAKRCMCCKSRIRCPYLVPDDLVRVRREVAR